MRLAPGLLALVLLAGFCQMSAGRDIELDENGRYNDVLVAVAEEIAEDWSLVQRIKEAFQEASVSLAIASRINSTMRSFAFGHVYILVPRSWSNSSVDQAATWHTEEAAHFRVGQRGNRIPNTVQPGECGRPGLHVRLHREHLRDTSAADLGKQLAHEFAHLRWGVFDEFNGPSGPHAFLLNGRLEPVRCSRTIRGVFGHKDTGGPCSVDRTTNQLEPDCRFITDASQTAIGSLMYATYLSSVRQFCTEARGNPDLDHNAAAPNPHNNRCGRRSMQEVMQQHADYQRAISGRETDTTVNFTVVQPQQARRLVIVMDVSGSMRGTPMAKMKIAVRTLLLSLLEDGIECSMITFSNVISVLKYMAPLDSAAVRREYWQSVTGLNANGATAIGDALARAMELLGTNVARPSKANTGYIMLLTDGEENRHTRYTFAQATAIAKQTSIVVDTVAFGNKADKLLADLSDGTGGKAYFVRFQSPANDLMEAMSDMVRERVTASQKPIDVFSSPVDASFSQNVQLDSSVNNGAQFTLSSPVSNGIRNTDLEVISPNGIVYSKLNSSHYLKEDSSGVITISTSGQVEEGDWTVSSEATVANPLRQRRRRDAPQVPTDARLSLVVTSRPSDSAPIILEGYPSVAKVRLSSENHVAVYATLQRGTELLLDAEITASVEGDSGLQVDFPLLDNGVGADATKNDGVYSSLVPTTVNTTQEYNIRLTSSRPVSRVSTAGKFEVTGVDLDSLSRTPPARVNDLRASVNLGGPTVSLEWTAVGQRGMEGAASNYSVYSCTSPDDLWMLSRCQLVPLQTSPAAPQSPAGTPLKATLTSAVLSTLEGWPSATFYMAVVGQSASDVRGEASNAVSLQTRLPDNLSEVERGAGGLSTLAIVFIVIGAVLGLVLVGVGVFLIVKKRPGRAV